MAAAAQLHGSSAAKAAYRRTPAFMIASSCRWPQNSLAGSTKLSISNSGMGMKPFGFGATISTKCANEARVEELNLRSDQVKDQVKELVKEDEHVIPQKRSAKIHDFCFGIPFGGLLFSMGLLGYIFSRSTISLVLGVAPGLTTLLLGTLSLKFWRSGKSSFLFILAQAAISVFLAWKYSHAYFLTNRLLPWGFYASLSTAMTCFYTYVLLAGGNPPPKKLAAIPPPYPA
ncbi:protein FATTY ACID EXPORT 1, chloroplastic-like [Phragmites australis]|uniref:protein FATTY ACID EXPORT 1, chloroplastic-like n=1 Tax=Phragmites australis TaxID=29695 RepID=UPI002D786214|nr:protein FATTY ACID EXPORT 1, chloroplastic-like [Phragmites australis]